MCCGVLQCVAMCHSVLQCVAVCFSVLQSVAVGNDETGARGERALPFVALCCGMS